MVVKALLGVRTNDVHTSVKYSVCSKTNRQITRTNNFFLEITSLLFTSYALHMHQYLKFYFKQINNKIFF